VAKISPVSIKYMIYASFKSEGPLEKPDVIGALFGQTEGLLGNELEMRELQKEGKIGRIEVELDTVDGKTVGEIQVPSALDKSETTLVAAALETIERIGPTEAEIKVAKIEDVRANKRGFIVDRAKELLERFDGGDSSGELSKSLKEESRAAKIQEYGEERLPAGDLDGSEVIVVEGRADVVNLLKNRVNNVIGMKGTKLPKEIAKLGKEKELILFIDGDRGGRLIAKNVVSNANVKYIAVAPDGKEVEELEGKEILMALRKKMDTEQFLRVNRIKVEESVENVDEVLEDEDEGVSISDDDAKDKLRSFYEGVKGNKAAYLLDGNFEVVRKIGIREVVRSLRNVKTKVFAIVLDGNVTGTVLDACEEQGVRFLGATNFGSSRDTKVKLVSL
tara:strand:- start:4578 stop:5750 length:1173 start_codon:yes stop_codon:yes gene_type:complete